MMRKFRMFLNKWDKETFLTIEFSRFGLIAIVIIALALIVEFS